MEVKYRFIFSDSYSSLPIIIGAPSFAASNDCKQLTLMNTIAFLTTSCSIAEEGNGFMD